MNDEQAEQMEIPLPLYNCRMQVRALKISGINLDSTEAKEDGRETDGSAMITPAEDGYVPFKIGAEYLRRLKPQVGGYYVVYKDGYKSYSPARAFEEGYTCA